jgi:hypothetical protein
VRTLVVVSVAAVLLAALPATGAVRIVLDSTEGDPVGGGRLRSLPVWNVSAVESQPGEIAVVKSDEVFRAEWAFVFRAPEGEALVPGVYEGATRGSNHQPGDPFLSVFTGTRQLCEFVTGRFEVLELTRYPSGGVRSFGADFEQRCEDGPPLRGSIRWSTGAGTCAGAAVGTPCDDLDACTPSSSCDGFQCVPAPIAACAATETCEVSVCDPATGACLGVVEAEDDAPCDDAEPCTQDESCQAGVCTGGSRPFCDDGDVCTDDFCTDGVGCTAAPAPGRCGLPGEPSSIVFLERTGLVGVADSRARWTSADGLFNVDVLRMGVRRHILRISANGRDTSAFLELAVPGETQLRPGTYVGATNDRDPTRPYLEAGAGSLCPDGTVGRFTVLVADWAPTGELLRFAADFTQQCRGADARPMVTGAVRYRTGDLACRTAPDGTACDPMDACVGAASCRDGLCVATDVTTCAAPDACRQASACDPRTGLCAEPLATYDGSPCDDADPCTTTSSCAGGACVGGDPLDCDDRNVCTADSCTPGVGCTSEPIDGSCWTLDGTITFAVAGRGRACRCTQALRHRTMALFANGVFRTGGTECPDTIFPGSTISVPDEVGLWFPARAGRLDLEPLNLGTVAEQANRCNAAVSEPQAIRRRLEMIDGGSALREKSSVLLARRGGRTIRATMRLGGVPGDGVRAPDALPMFGEWDACLAKLGRCMR